MISITRREDERDGIGGTRRGAPGGRVTEGIADGGLGVHDGIVDSVEATGTIRSHLTNRLSPRESRFPPR